ncbi:MAG: DUF86 domain-containing protein [Planctomycetota bacterium]
MSGRPVRNLIEDIWESIGKIEEYVAGCDHDTFVRDRKTLDATVRNLEIIGEAAGRLPETFRLQHDTVEWIIGLRHRIAHDYFGIDVEIVWQILQRDLPELKSKLEVIRRGLA